MGKIERAIKALEALPPERQDEVADMILELADAVQRPPGKSVLTEDQLAEVQRRRETFRPGDPGRIDQLIARLK
ncbi:MAG: hypothetical protein JSS00_07740 [Proteobacteria bacterium]|nr:hypothetical protein [Pseudomonadota bacterium]